MSSQQSRGVTLSHYPSGESRISPGRAETSAGEAKQSSATEAPDPGPQPPGMSAQSQQPALTLPSETAAVCSVPPGDPPLPVPAGPGSGGFSTWAKTTDFHCIVFLFQKSYLFFTKSLQTTAKPKQGNFKLALDSRDNPLWIHPRTPAPGASISFGCLFTKSAQTSLLAIWLYTPARQEQFPV